MPDYRDQLTADELHRASLACEYVAINSTGKTHSELLAIAVKLKIEAQTRATEKV